MTAGADRSPATPGAAADARTRLGSRARGPLPRRGRAGGMRASQRGVALIMVTAVVAILTAVAVEFTYRQRVAMHLAANARDELRAEYMAKSGVQLGRLLLSFQKQVDNLQIPGLGDPSALLGMLSGSGIDPGMLAGLGVDPNALQNLAGQAGGLPGAGGAAGAQGGGGLGIRLWELIPLDSGLIQMFLGMVSGTPDEPPLDPNAPVLSPFGDFQGGFQVEITDEESKINVNQLEGLGQAQKAALINLMALVQDPRYDFLFDEEDRWGVRMTRPETIGAIKDYIDPNQVQDSIIMGATGPEMVPGSGDETYYYGRFEPRYKPKNAGLDSLTELYQIAGVNDYFMSAFGDRLTVYTDKNAKLNATPQNMLDLVLRCVIAADAASQQFCFDPVLMATVWEQLQMQRAMLPFIGITPAALKATLEGNGIATNPYAFQGTNAVFGNTSRTFTIEATGQAGDIQKKITAVVRMEDGDPLGKLLHWTER